MTEQQLWDAVFGACIMFILLGAYAAIYRWWDERRKQRKLRQYDSRENRRRERLMAMFHGFL
jgi:hypothetical protein